LISLKDIVAEPPRVLNETPNINGDANAPKSPGVVGYNTNELGSLENQGVEICLFLSIQPLASQPSLESVGSSQDSPLASHQPISNFLLFPPNPLFESYSYVYLSPRHLYHPFETPNVPMIPSTITT